MITFSGEEDGLCVSGNPHQWEVKDRKTIVCHTCGWVLSAPPDWYDPLTGITYTVEVSGV